MSAQSEIGKLAFIIGKEVADNVGKKAAPVVAKAVPKAKKVIEGWGFKPKPGQIASKDFVDVGNKYYSIVNKPTKTLEESNIKSKLLNKFDSINDSYYKQIVNAQESGKLNMMDLSTVNKLINTRDKPIDIIAKQFATLEKMGVPRKYTGKIFNMSSIPSEQIDIAKTLKQLNPPERDVFMHFMGSYGGKKYATTYTKNIKDLTRSQQETFASLLPEWKGSMEELIQAAKNL